MTLKSLSTIRDVARQAGVSVATVSRLLNDPAVVAPETASRVQAAITDLKYVPRSAARNLATRKTNTIGLVLTDIAGDFFIPLLSGIEAATSEAGYDLLISTSGRPDTRSKFPRILGAHNTDGLLIFANGLNEASLRYCYESGQPMVLIHKTPPKELDIPCVTVENKAAACKIVEHLITVHRRGRIVYLKGPEDHDDSHWRELGYREALKLHNIPFDPALVACGDFLRTTAETTIADLLQAGTPIDAIFAGDDEAAVGVLAALQAAGKHVPEDIAVVGFDDQRLSAYLTPPLTTVRAPTEHVGYEAVQQLLKIIRTGQADPLTLLPTEMILRLSCGCAF